MKIVWHHPGMRQKDWIRFVFSSVATGEIEDPNFNCFEDNTIHVVSMIFKPLREMADYFSKSRAVCKNLVLYHAGDEWLSGGCHPYRYFDNVVREMPSFFTRGAGIMAVPLGCPTTQTTEAPVRPASQRQLIWSFVGEIRNTRIEMLNHFKSIPYGKLIDTNSSSPLAPAEYQGILRATVFAPCGMGNIITETWRVYEAIEAGAIPIVERRATLDYYKNLLGKHPLPTFSHWHKASAFVRSMIDDENGLDSLQRDVMSWWQGHKAKMVDDVSTMLATSHNKNLIEFSGALTNSSPVFHEALRVTELLRHQSFANVRRRLQSPKKPLRRVILGLSGRDER